jgi:hypothetical protein
MDLLNQVIAGLFAKFKQSSPTVAAIILSALIAAAAFLQAPSTAELLGESATNILKWVNIALIALVGTPTTKFIDKVRK